MNLLPMAFIVASQTFDLPPGLLSAMCYVESKHKINARHKDDGAEDSIGVCQLHLTTAKELGYKGTAKGLYDPQTNLFYAAKYLNKQLKRYNKDIIKGVCAYNRGTYRVQDNKPVNQDYLYKVLKAWADGK